MSQSPVVVYLLNGMLCSNLLVSYRSSGLVVLFIFEIYYGNIYSFFFLLEPGNILLDYVKCSAQTNVLPQQLEKFYPLLQSFNVVSSSVQTMSMWHCTKQIHEEISPNTYCKKVLQKKPQKPTTSKLKHLPTPASFCKVKLSKELLYCPQHPAFFFPNKFFLILKTSVLELELSAET